MSYHFHAIRVMSRSRCRVLSPSIQARFASTKLDSETISKITEKEKSITRQDQPVTSGPTAHAQKHVDEELNAQNISDITKGEKNITGRDGPIKDGPTSTAQKILTSQENLRQLDKKAEKIAKGVFDSEKISKITDAEKKITGSAGPVQGGPTAEAQKHANEPITSEALSDITKGEKRIAGGRIKGGPTSTAQSELGKSRN